MANNYLNDHLNICHPMHGGTSVILSHTCKQVRVGHVWGAEHASSEMPSAKVSVLSTRLTLC